MSQADSHPSQNRRSLLVQRLWLHLTLSPVVGVLILVVAVQPGLLFVLRVAVFGSLGICAYLMWSTHLRTVHAIQEVVEHATIAKQAQEAHHRVEELFAMTDMLQAAESHEDAGSVLMATSRRLLPGYCGALYVFNNSRDRLDLAKSWNELPDFDLPEALLPSQCWALKRGKAHLNDFSKQTLCCSHHNGETSSVEVPMLARGQVFGLLIVATDGESTYERLSEVSRLVRALGDSMSLALSNIALREKLRTLSLRDPLTGLYNRRYMEDALQRYVDLGARTGGATGVIMIDLDNFKRLNDEHGHAKGDAVLRDVAGQLVGALRPADVVARYGGEELLVILPNCTLDDARNKAETLRARIAGLSETHGCPISASFGVTAVPETASGATDVIAMADSALYAAKKDGKNCVHAADRRAERLEVHPRLVVS